MVQSSNPEDRQRQEDRRFQVFISSTFRDLDDERKKAISVIVDQHHIPIALENFAASHSTDFEVIGKSIRDSQIYLVILGHRYGEIASNKTLSYTEIEYDLAMENGLLIIPFILSSDEILARRNKLKPNDPHDQKEIANVHLLEAFHNKVKKHFYKSWEPKDEFKYLVLDALKEELSKCKKPGLTWEKTSEQKQFLTYASENEFIVEIVKSITRFEKLDHRCTEHVDKKMELARFFVQNYGDLIVRRQASIFFESGSTVAFVASQLVSFIQERNVSIDIKTNNVLAYLRCWLTAGIPCSLFPLSSPREPYGASYGIIENLPDSLPDYPPQQLSAAAKRVINDMAETIGALGGVDKPNLMLGTISALQLGEVHKIEGPSSKEGISKAPSQLLERNVNKCFGPHVGSYHNKLFKRYMYNTNLPVMLFITEEKIDLEIIVGRCHFILDQEQNDDSDLTWETFYNNYPVAFCVGCDGDSMEDKAAAFKELGFHVIMGPQFGVSAFIARNNKFINRFET